MRVGVNALFFIPGGLGGGETVLRNILRNLAKIDTKNEYVVFVAQEGVGALGIEQSNFVEVVAPVNARFRPARILWEQCILPIQARKYRIDVLYSPGITSPAVLPCPSIVVMHDMIYYYYPRSFSRPNLFFVRVLYPLSARRASKIIAVSESTKQDIMGLLHIPADRITVIYNGCELERFHNCHDERQIRRAREKYQLNENFILFVGSTYPHKNIEGLLQAYYDLKIRHQIPHQLVLIGIHTPHANTLKKIVAKFGLQDTVVWGGYVPDEDIPFLYAGADLFVLPSLYEGFGIPVLEAMASGTPVVFSNVTSLPEVVGDAGLSFDPTNSEDVAEKMYQALTTEALREDLVARGWQRVQRFSWQKAAQKTLSVFEETIACSDARKNGPSARGADQ